MAKPRVRRALSDAPSAGSCKTAHRARRRRRSRPGGWRSCCPTGGASALDRRVTHRSIARRRRSCASTIRASRAVTASSSRRDERVLVRDLGVDQRHLRQRRARARRRSCGRARVLHARRDAAARGDGRAWTIAASSASRSRCSACAREIDAAARRAAAGAGARRDRHRQGAGGARAARAERAARARSCRSTAARSRRSSSRASCSATSAARSPAPTVERAGRVPGGATAARCSSTRSASCPTALQPRLLRALESGVVRPVGANRELAGRRARGRGDARRPRSAAVARGRFREDLYYRLRGGGARHAAAARARRTICGCSSRASPRRARRPAARCRLSPTRAERARRAPLAGQRARAARTCCGARPRSAAPSSTCATSSSTRSRRRGDGGDDDSVRVDGRTYLEIEREVLRARLRRYRGNQRAAADALRIPKSTLVRQGCVATASAS